MNSIEREIHRRHKDRAIKEEIKRTQLAICILLGIALLGVILLAFGGAK